MKVIESQLSDSSVSAKLLAEEEDCAPFMNPQGAVESCIERYVSQNALPPLICTRVTQMDVSPEGSVVFSFEAGFMPEVKLGQYKNLKLNAGFDSDIEKLALNAAAANVEMTVPELAVERRLDTMMTEKQAEVLESSSVNALTDMEAILERLNLESGSPLSSGDVQTLAAKAAQSYVESGSMDILAFTEALQSVFPADEETLGGMINDRIYERQSCNPEELAAKTFDAYLRVSGKTVESWRRENRDEAVRLCVIDFMLDEIIRVEDIGVAEDEFSSSLTAISMQYQIPRDEILNIIPREAVEYQVKLGKARSLITETAVQ